MTAQIAALSAGEELIDPATFAAVFSRTGDAAERRVALAHEPARLEAEIDACGSRGEITKLALRLARGYCEAAAVFLVRRGVVHGVAGEGCPGRAETALFPKAMPSVFSRVIQERKAFRGAPPDRTLERRVLRSLGREGVQEIAILPAALGGRVVTLLYADNGPDPVGDAALAALGAVATRLGRAYERLILARKQAA